MECTVVLSKDDLSALKQFHLDHFPGQIVPSLESSAVHDDHISKEHVPDEAELGYYEDGVKRTLTEDQIAMLRNSEVQRIIQERRRAVEKEEQRKERERSKQDDDNSRQGEQRSWTKHFDEPLESVDTLVYDEGPSEATQSDKKPKRFHWPKLG